MPRLSPVFQGQPCSQAALFMGRKGGSGPGDISGTARDEWWHLAGDVEQYEICGKVLCWGGEH